MLGNTATGKERRVPDDGFRLPGASYEELCKIITAYAAQPGVVSTPQVAQLLGTDPTVISRNNAFLTGVGILDEAAARRKVVTDVGRTLGRALEHGIAEDVSHSWRQIVEKSDFLSRVVSAVRIRKGMEPSNLQSHIAYSAGQRKSSLAVTGARTVMAILEAANVLQNEDGKFVVRESAPARAGDEAPVRAALRQSARSSTFFRWTALADQDSGSAPGLSISLELQIQCKPSDLRTLAPQVQRFLRELTGEAGSDGPDEEPSGADGDG